MGNDDPRKEVPMTAELIEDVWVRMPRGRDWTSADLQDIPDDGHRYEIIDGSLHVSAAPTPWHQLVASELVAVLRPAVPPALLVVETLDVDLGGSVLEPDVLVVDRSAVTHDARRLKPSDVVLAIEIESPSSRRFDRLLKPSIYAAGAIPHYWRVDLDDMDAPAIVRSVLDGGIYREVGTVRAGESVVVDVPFRVELRPAELVGPRRRG
jgi:Uma2 family endonuclease